MLNTTKPILTINYITTPLGTMLAAANNTHLYALEFIEEESTFPASQKLFARGDYQIVPGTTSIHEQISTELAAYFSGILKQFTVPFYLQGTTFQKKTWQALTEIPYANTISYADLAAKINQRSAHRAVANANGANNLAIIIPCHRVINSNGRLGGYRSGLERKVWLLQHEQDKFK